MRTASALLLCLSMSGPLLAGETDNLLSQAKPPARFKDHKASFTVQPKEFEFASAKGPQKETLWLVMDGDRYVAIYKPGSGEIDLINFRPDQCPTDLKMPSRYHWGTCLGTRITTVPWAFGWAPTGDVRKTTWEGGGQSVVVQPQTAGPFPKNTDKLTLVEHQEWTKRKAQSTHTITLSCDPVVGYVLDMDCNMSSQNEPAGNKKTVELTNVLHPGMSNVWPERQSYDHTVYTPANGKPGEYAGWCSNLPAADKSDNAGLNVRPGGFIAFLTDKQGWGIAMNNVASERMAGYSNATCNAWQDQHKQATFPNKKDSDGLYSLKGKYRIEAMPPEVAKIVLDHTKINDFGGEKQVQVRIGQDEGFEDQPLPLTTTARGAWGGGLTVASDKAHSGKNSVVVNAVPADKPLGMTGFLNAPQIALDANTKYHIEAWVLVEGDDTQAWIGGDLYDNSPHDPARLVTQKSNVAKAGKEWQKLELDFTTDAVGPYIDLRFLATGTGKAYFDDFKLVPAK